MALLGFIVWLVFGLASLSTKSSYVDKFSYFCCWVVLMIQLAEKL